MHLEEVILGPRGSRRKRHPSSTRGHKWPPGHLIQRPHHARIINRVCWPEKTFGSRRCHAEVAHCTAQQYTTLHHGSSQQCNPALATASASGHSTSHTDNSPARACVDPQSGPRVSRCGATNLLILAAQMSPCFATSLRCRALHLLGRCARLRFPSVAHVKSPIAHLHHTHINTSSCKNMLAPCLSLGGDRDLEPQVRTSLKHTTQQGARTKQIPRVLQGSGRSPDVAESRDFGDPVGVPCWGPENRPETGRQRVNPNCRGSLVVRITWAQKNRPHIRVASDTATQHPSWLCPHRSTMLHPLPPCR